MSMKCRNCEGPNDEPDYVNCPRCRLEQVAAEHERHANAFEELKEKAARLETIVTELVSDVARLAQEIDRMKEKS